ncbi:hypothetical protein QUC32_28390 (plasmid) [Novosphingobium resinovorum]|jgi:drug/metabolite transporter superfamily protein YnfA|nr:MULTISPECIES: hypothetical protein [Sphingomonadaceae]EJU11485.1 hypothetical protein LH128_18664 [Sphingomonas sp. LH128]MBF7015601.1 hypothetical protein [Novosphingobium sp. HR1a]WJM30276.1 hypothetical protein QUC32_28390 [Novosphingobium resinovorum]
MAAARKAGGGVLLADQNGTIGCIAWVLLPTIHRGTLGRIGAATGSMIVGTVATMSGAVDSFALTQSDFDAMGQRLALAGAKAREQARDELERINFARLFRRRATLLDLLVICGASLADVLRHPGDVPLEVQQAFALA